MNTPIAPINSPDSRPTFDRGQSAATIATAIGAQEALGRGGKLGADRHIRKHLGVLLSRLFPSGRVAIERRAGGRYPFPFLFRISPIDPKTLEPAEETMVVVGKNISESGLGFFHQSALPNRLAIVHLDDAVEGEVSLLVNLTWCRFTRHGWYESGGRFLRVVNEKPSAS